MTNMQSLHSFASRKSRDDRYGARGWLRMESLELNVFSRCGGPRQAEIRVLS